MVAEHLAPWSLGPCAWPNNMAAETCSRERRSPQTGRTGVGVGRRETVPLRVHPSDLPLPSRSQHPEILKPPSIASAAGGHTSIHECVMGGHDRYRDDNGYTEMARPLIHFLSSNSFKREPLRVTLA